MTTTQGMADHYDQHSEYQRAVAATGAALIEQCVQATPLADGATFVVADYGASTGKNSIASVRTAVDAVRSASPTRPVAVLHNDVPTNDWNTLFANVVSDEHSYLHAAEFRRCSPLASAITFFEPAAPAGSVHLGVSFSAAHWLREQPTVAVDGFYFCDATGDAATTLTAQADADWTAFLTARAQDLAPGARLLVQDVGTEPVVGGDGARHREQAADGDARRRRADGRCRRARSRCRGAVPPPRVRPHPGRGCRANRRDSDLAAAFTVIEARTDPVANPYLTAWKADGDAAAYGKAYATFVRGFTESSFREHLFTPGAVGQVEQRIDEYFARLEHGSRPTPRPTRSRTGR